MSAPVDPPRLATKYPSYEAAAEAARSYSDYYQVSMGIEAGWAYPGAAQGSAWCVRHLPPMNQRFGIDARIEAVEPTPPRKSR